MTHRQPDRPRRSSLLPALVVVGGVVLGAFSYQSLGHTSLPSPLSAASPIAGVPPGLAPPA